MDCLTDLCEERAKDGVSGEVNLGDAGYDADFLRLILVRSRHHHTIWSILGAIITVIVIQIIVSIIVALSSRREPIDERDRMIEYKSFRAA